jgi:hypothetical protein
MSEERYQAESSIRLLPVPAESPDGSRLRMSQLNMDQLSDPIIVGRNPMPRRLETHYHHPSESTAGAQRKGADQLALMVFRQ